MQTIESGSAMQDAIRQARRDGRRVGLVPTMGALHAGHLSLVDAASAECDRVAVSIFVNPTQFGPGEDFAAYPRDVERDLQLLVEREVDWAFVPKSDAMFRPEHSTFVSVGPPAEPWEGAIRPTHFRGVATVVLKLLHLVPADVAYFGQKDYQQTVVIRQMVADLDVPLDICICPTVREADGLAMSSRNAYLSPSQRQAATALYQALELAQSLVADGLRDATEIRGAMLTRLGQAQGLTVDYAALLADGTVEEVAEVAGPTIAVVAARLGKTRLIDNLKIA